MRTLLIDNIAELVTNDPTLGEGPLGVIADAAVAVAGGRVTWVGRSAQAGSADERWDADGAAVIPGFVESHSHIVFAGDRGHEFAARFGQRGHLGQLKGATPAPDPGREGGHYRPSGIQGTLTATRAASDAELAANTARLVAEYARGGTTTVEIKSGYGQTVADEVRSLAIAGRFTDETTLLAAHVTPAEFAGRADDYVRLVVDEMVPAAAPHARWIDVFCERGAFTPEQSREVLLAGIDHGLTPRVHGNQLGHTGGVALAVEVGAASVDHVVYLSDADVAALGASETVATLLPGADFSTRGPYPDGRRLIDAGATVALGADCNPGTSYTTSLAFCMALAVRECGLTPDEALLAATAGGARALRRDDVGRLRPGSRADLVVLDAPSRLHLTYRPGVDLIGSVMREGVWT